MHPAFLEVIDTDHAVHLIRLERVSRVTLTGAPSAPEAEVWLMFGGTLRLGPEQTRRLRDQLHQWGQVIRCEPYEPQGG
jgi:hypothetical protein